MRRSVLAVFLLALIGAPVLAGLARAEDLPCQTESVEMDYNARRMYGDGYSNAEYREFEAKTDEWERKFIVCMDEYERVNGPEARKKLSDELSAVTRGINEARRG